MSDPVRVFIASSSEKLPVVGAIATHLVDATSVDICPAPWNQQEFKLSAGYIESLEAAMHKADYVVLVVSSDDVAIARKKKHKIPRDNVLFEVGLAMGKLERKRCFLVHSTDEHGAGGPNLPSDLKDVKTATYPKGCKDLGQALQTACDEIVARITELEEGKRNSFCGRAAGAWWERIKTKTGIELSFFRIVPDRQYQSVQLIGGQHFSGSGDPIGHWNSTLVGVRPVEREILYGWKGSHPAGWAGDKSSALPDVEGFGRLTFFDRPGVFTRGVGNFIDVVPNDAASAESKYVDLARIADEDHVQKITEGSEAEMRALVTDVLADWLASTMTGGSSF